MLRFVQRFRKGGHVRWSFVSRRINLLAVALICGGFLILVAQIKIQLIVCLGTDTDKLLRFFVQAFVMVAATWLRSVPVARYRLFGSLGQVSAIFLLNFDTLRFWGLAGTD